MGSGGGREGRGITRRDASLRDVNRRPRSVRKCETGRERGTVRGRRSGRVRVGDI